MFSRQFLRLTSNCRRFRLTVPPRIIHGISKMEISPYTTRMSSTQFNSNNYDLQCDTSNIEVPFSVKILLESDASIAIGHDIVEAMTDLTKLHKFKRIPMNQLSQQNFYKDFFSFVEENAEKLTVSESLEVMKNLVKLQVPGSSKIVYSVLKNLQGKIKDLSMIEYNILSDQMNKMTRSTLTKPLKLLMQSHFVSCLLNKSKENDSQFLAQALRYCYKNMNDKRILEIIADQLQQLNFSTVPVSDALSIFKSFSAMQHINFSGWERILKNVINICSKNIQQIRTSDLKIILYRMSVKLQKKDRIEELYNSELCDEIVREIISRDVGFDNALDCLKYLIEIRHTSIDLLNYLSAKFYDSKYLSRKIISNETQSLLILLNAMSAIRYKPLVWTEIFGSLKKSSKLPRMPIETLIVYSLHLAVLDCFDNKILEQLLCYEHDIEPNSYINWATIKLCQILKTHPNYNGPLPSDKLIASFANMVPVRRIFMQPNLEHALGGSDYVISNVRTKLNHSIDCVVAFNNGHPIPINQNQENKKIQYLEDLNVPAGSEIVAVVASHPSWYSRNKNEMIGVYSCYFETLEALSYKAVIVPEKEWKTLLDDNKDQFLLEALRTKLNKEIHC
ncbi:uncharacterized protein LOC106653853 [Trichogramma pretiosum]|uniref:uncharacterized protein LOC106653853 n=1 Tax=Trichogramma pretiosum TaxID=7493 RepID=UPI0006C9512A|nr:uncharacterized protein LOC106653853 [Trichogramma pretiosum]